MAKRIRALLVVAALIALLAWYDSTVDRPAYEPPTSIWECDTWRYTPSRWDYQPVCDE